MSAFSLYTFTLFSVWSFCALRFKLTVTFRFCNTCVIIGSKFSLILISLYINHKHGHTCDYNINYLQKHNNRAMRFYRDFDILP